MEAMDTPTWDDWPIATVGNLSPSENNASSPDIEKADTELKRKCIICKEVVDAREELSDFDQIECKLFCNCIVIEGLAICERYAGQISDLYFQHQSKTKYFRKLGRKCLG
jgi:hypothetical protein